MLVTWWSLNRQHQLTAQCKKGAGRKLYCLAAEEEIAVASWLISMYGCPLDMVTSFRYLGRVILTVDDNWPEVIRNLVNPRAVCRRIIRILSREGARPRVSGFFFKAVVQ